MNFNNDKAIYIQIADRLCDEILAGTYQDDERIPSVREYAVLTGLLRHERGEEEDPEGTQAVVHEGEATRDVPTHAAVGYRHL